MFLNCSTCFGRHTAHHQELKNCNCILWFYIRLWLPVAAFYYTVASCWFFPCDLLKMCVILEDGVSRVQKSLSSHTFYIHGLKVRKSANHLSFSHPSHLIFLSIPSFHLYILSRAVSTCFRVDGQRTSKGQYRFFFSTNNFIGQTIECSSGQSEVDIRL